MIVKCNFLPKIMFLLVKPMHHDKRNANFQISWMNFKYEFIGNFLSLLHGGSRGIRISTCLSMAIKLSVGESVLMKKQRCIAWLST